MNLITEGIVVDSMYWVLWALAATDGKHASVAKSGPHALTF